MLTLPNIPIIGEPCQMILWYPTLLINCRCQENRVTIIVTTGFNNPSACWHCGKIYYVTAIGPEVVDGLPMVHLQITMPQVKKELH